MDVRRTFAARRLPMIVAAFAAAILLLLTVIALFPWSWTKPLIERRLSAATGRPVTIGSVSASDRLSLSPVLELHDLTIRQAPWAGTGDLARVRTIGIRFPVLPLLIGRFSPHGITVSGMRLDLVRAADGRENWRAARKQSAGGGLALDQLSIADSVIAYRDAKQLRAFRATVSADATHGLRIAGNGMVDSRPVTLLGTGAPIAGGKRPWPFDLRIVGQALSMHLAGTTDAPADFSRLSMTVTAEAEDLKMIDRVIEAGLIGTQRVRLAANVRHEQLRWDVRELTGTIGQTGIAGHVMVQKVDGRTRLDGAVVADHLRFDDFVSDSGLAEAAALREDQGPKFVPNARINIAKIDHTDGTIAFTVRSIVGDTGPTALAGMEGRLTLDHQLLTVAPFTLRLTRGAITGSMVVDQRGAPPLPTVTLDLSLTGSSLGAIVTNGDGTIDGRLDGRAHIVGRGSTIREVVGAGDGMVGLYASDGMLPTKLAALLGFDLGRSVFAGKESRQGLRCGVIRLDMRHGLGTVNPLLVDTDISQSTGTGTVRFPDEAIAIRLTGAPKSGTVLRVPGAVTLGGTVKQPAATLPRDTVSVGNILKAVGRGIFGGNPPDATDADCAALRRRALQ